MARPKSEYNPALIPDIKQAGKEGKTWNMICTEVLGVAVSTANDWVKKYPEFAAAREVARTNARAYWEALVLENINSRTFNSRLAEMMLKALDPENYREPKHQLDANIKADVKIDLKAETDKLISELEEAAKKKTAKKEEK